MNTSVFKNHFSVYWKALRMVFLIVFAILAFNITIQVGVVGLVGGGSEHSLMIIIPMMFTALLGSLAIYEGSQKDSFFVDGEKELVISFRSRMDEGDLTFNVYSPNNEIVYTVTGAPNEQVTIPLTPGEWNYSLTFDQAKDGEISLRGYLRE